MSYVTLVDVATGEVSRVNVSRPVLHQDEVWVDINGKEHQIKRMSHRYVRNVIRFLEERAYALHHNEVVEMAEFLNGPLGPRGDMATDAADEAYDELIRDNPSVWLSGTTLMQALRKRLMQPDAPEMLFGRRR